MRGIYEHVDCVKVEQQRRGGVRRDIRAKNAHRVQRRLKRGSESKATDEHILCLREWHRGMRHGEATE